MNDRLTQIGRIGLRLSVVGIVLYPLFFYSLFKCMNNNAWPVMIVLIVLMGLPVGGLVLWKCARGVKDERFTFFLSPLTATLRILLMGGAGGLVSGIIGSGLFSLVLCLTVLISQGQTEPFYPMFLETGLFAIIPGVVIGVPTGLLTAGVIARYLLSDYP